MSVTALTCPACGAPAPATSGSCAYCDATLQVPSTAPAAGSGGGPPGQRLDLVLHGLTPAHVGILVSVLGRPEHIMAQVPGRHPPAVFGVPADQANRLAAALAPHGVHVQSRPASGQGGFGPARPGGGPGQAGPRGAGFGPGGRGPGFGPHGRGPR